MKNWTIFTPDSIFNFGRNKGKSLEEVAEFDAPYIYWCALNIDKFLISEKDFLAFQNKYEKTFVAYCLPPYLKIEKPTNFYTVNEAELEILRAKWNNYENKKEEHFSEYDYYEHDYSVDSNPYYNDNLDMDQQDPEFWDWF